MKRHDNHPSMVATKRRPFSSLAAPVSQKHKRSCETDIILNQADDLESTTAQPEFQDARRHKTIQGFQGIADSRGRIQFADVDQMEGLGYTEEEILRKPFWEIGWFAQSSESQELVKEGVRSALKGHIVRCQVITFPKEGKALPITFTMQPLKGREGAIISISAEMGSPDTEPSQGTPLIEGGINTNLKQIALQESGHIKLFEQAREGIGIYQDDFLTYANPSLLTMAKQYGLDIEKRPLAKLLSPQATEFLTKRMQQRLAGEDVPGVYNIDLVTSSGNTVPMEMNSTLIDYKGKPAILFIARDITDRIQIEEARIEAEMRYRAILNNPMQMVFTNDLQGKFIEVNNTFMDITGYAIEDTKELTYREVFHPDDLPKVLDNIAMVTAGHSVHPLEIRIVPRSASKEDDTFWISTIFVPIEYNDEIHSMIGFATDITERIKAEEERANAYQQLRYIFDNVDVVLFANDFVNSRILEISPSCEKVYGVPRESFFNNPLLWQEMIHPDDQQAILSKSTTILSGNSLSMEYRIVRLDGTIRWLDAHMKPSLDAMGNLIRIDGIIVDITERKYVEDKLKQSNQELQEFVKIASHDLQEPLRKISAFGDLLANSLGTRLDGDEKENLNFILDGTHRMHQTIDALSIYSQLMANNVRSHKVDLNRVVKDIRKSVLSSAIRETNGSIEIPKPLPVINADRMQMYQLLNNLIRNGLKYHRQDSIPRVEVRAQTNSNKMVRVEVEDNGIGIESEYQDEIFNMFRRLHHPSEYTGTGIGLAICKKIVQRHGGEIGVESLPGKGSTFWFTAPSVTTKK
ncbi:MAG: PAS domain S-box protein [Chloroflexota bacterium]|nr:PAS domain S-box protein [Chloroflexota bacterium]